MTAEGDAEDQRLLREIAAGQAAALRTLMRRHAEALLRYASHLLGDAHAGEDALQHVFIQVWRHANGWRPEAKVRTWLYTIVQRHCLNQLRARKSMIELEDAPLEDHAGRPDALYSAEQVRQFVAFAMDALPERQRTALLLRYAEGFSQKEAAAILDISEKALESLLSRGKSALAKYLSPYKEALL